METKVCNRCDVEKILYDFPIKERKNGKVRYRGYCKVCLNAKRRIKYNESNDERKIKYKKNKDEINKLRREHSRKNKERINQYKREWTKKNKERLSEYNKKWREENPEKFIQNKGRYKGRYKDKWSDWSEERKEKHRLLKRKNHNKRYNEDNLYRLKICVTSNIRQSFVLKGYSKKSKTFKILGCSFEDFKCHIESQFEDWMNWDNYGIYNGGEKCGWDLDHIVPVSSAQCEEDIIRLNHHSNIQPLCSYVNRDVKRDNIDWKS